MKSLAELKRIIKPGLRLRCISNTFRPELNGKIRVVCRVQTNAFTWKHEGETAAAEKESWTNYEKASSYSFDGNRFSFWLGKPGPVTPASVTLEVLQ